MQGRRLGNPALKQLPVRSEKRMRPVVLADRNLMRHHAAEALSGKPAVKMKRRRLDLERRLPQLRQVKIDRVIGRRTDRSLNPGKHGQSSAMSVPGGNQLHAWMAPDEQRQLCGIEEILPVHMPYPRLERWMVLCSKPGSGRDDGHRLMRPVPRDTSCIEGRGQQSYRPWRGNRKRNIGYLRRPKNKKSPVTIRPPGGCRNLGRSRTFPLLFEGFSPIQCVRKTPWIRRLIHPVAGANEVVGRDEIGSGIRDH